MADANGLYYEEFGTGTGTPLILSAGLGGSGAYWAPNIDGLAEGYRGANRIIVYDHRGTGRSDRALPDTVTVEDMARDTLSLMDTLEIPKAIIVGHAAGGVAGLSLALIAPERVERLVVVNGWAKADPHFLNVFRMRKALLDGAGPEAYVRAQPLFLYPPYWFYGKDQAALDADAAGHLAHFPAVETMHKRIDSLAAFDIVDRLSEIVCPTLLIAAYDDLLVPWQCTTKLYNGLPDATYAFMRAGAHACNVTDPERFEEIVLLWLANAPITEE